MGKAGVGEGGKGRRGRKGKGGEGRLHDDSKSQQFRRFLASCFDSSLAVPPPIFLPISHSAQRRDAPPDLANQGRAVTVLAGFSQLRPPERA